MINIVSSVQIINTIKTNSKYFSLDLGHSALQENKKDFSGNLLNKIDEFVFNYRVTYNTSILKQGKMGDGGSIGIYTDYSMKPDIVAVYDDNKEYICEYDKEMVKNKGIDSFLGYLIMEINKTNNNIDNMESGESIKGNKERIFLNPGSVNIKDIEEFLKNKSNKK